jgi:hypothetical protein
MLLQLRFEHDIGALPSVHTQDMGIILISLILLEIWFPKSQGNLPIFFLKSLVQYITYFPFAL